MPKGYSSYEELVKNPSLFKQKLYSDPFISKFPVLSLKQIKEKSNESDIFFAKEINIKRKINYQRSSYNPPNKQININNSYNNVARYEYSHVNKNNDNKNNNSNSIKNQPIQKNLSENKMKINYKINNRSPQPRNFQRLNIIHNNINNNQNIVYDTQ